MIRPKPLLLMEYPQPVYCAFMTPTRKKPISLRMLNETFVPDERKIELRKRLRRLQGQVAGVERMLNENRGCVDILTQASAAQEALRGFSRVMVLNYLERCATEAFKEGRQDDVYDDLMKVIFKLAR